MGEAVDAPPAAGAAAASEPLEPLSPSTLIALPETVTGTARSTGACVPEAIPSEPEVVALAAAGAVAAGADADESVPEESPTALTALPATVTGTSTLTSAWDPLRTPSMPLVDTSTAGAGADGAAAAVESVEVESPTREMPLPPTVTGTVTPTTACVPDAVPSVPLVDGASAAFAAAVPASQSPPTQRVNHSPLETYVFIVQPFE